MNAAFCVIFFCGGKLEGLDEVVILCRQQRLAQYRTILIVYLGVCDRGGLSISQAPRAH